MLTTNLKYAYGKANLAHILGGGGGCSQHLKCFYKFRNINNVTLFLTANSETNAL